MEFEKLKKIIAEVLNVDSDRQCNHQKLNKFTEQGYYFHEWYPFSVVFRSHISEAWHKPQA